MEHVFCFVSFLQCLVWFAFSSVPRWPNTTTPVCPPAPLLLGRMWVSVPQQWPPLQRYRR